MAKRFTDTLIWEKEWFMKLSPKHKCLFKYIVDRCDPAGVWEQNWTLASIYIGEKVDFSDTLVLASHLEKLPSGKILVIDFISFQYGKLSEKCAAHIPIFKAIEKNKLSLDRVSNRVFYTLQEKETETEEEKETETEEEKETETEEEKETETEIKGVKGENNFSETFLTAFDELTMESFALNFKNVDVQEELRHFRLKCDNDKLTYHSRDPATLRTNFLYQLKTAKPKQKNGGFNKKQQQTDDLIKAHAARWGSDAPHVKAMD